MMKRGPWALLSLLLFGLHVYAAVGTWKNFTSMKDVKGLVQSGGTTWAASSGGLFAWDELRNTYQLYTSAEGLQNVDLTAIGADRYGNIWTGTSTGIIHVYSPANNSWRYVADIASSSQTNKRINRLAVFGDTVLICTDFGLSVFKDSRFEFGDTFSRFGPLPPSVRVRVLDAVLFQDSIWAAIDDGQGNSRLAVASLTSPNLLPPESWSLRVVGTPATAPKTLCIFNGRLYTGTDAGLYVAQSGAWVPVTPLQNANIVSVAASPTRLAACTASNTVFAIDVQNNATQYGGPLPFSATSVALGTADRLFVGSLSGGVLSLAATWQSHLPNGPASNQFLSVAVDPDGVVWGATGIVNGSGFCRYDGKAWTSFTAENSGLPLNNYWKVSVGCNGSLWASSWGRGVVEVPQGSNSIDSTHIFGRNVGMAGITGDPSFIVVSSVICDGRGNTWMSVRDAADKNILVVRKADGSWVTLPVFIQGVKIGFLQDSPVDRSLAVDAFDNLWAVVRDPPYKGVISLGNRGSLDGTAAFHITSANGLPSDEIKTIVADRDNNIWVGTGLGIAIILDPSNPTGSSGIASYKPLNGLVINTIAVDPLNQKWIGTTEGVIVLSPDGTQQLASYTVATTAGKLIDNDVKSIAFDGKSGTVYFGTLSGLASLTTAAPAPKVDYDKLTAAPDPYLVPSTTLLTIDGLVENSSLKILSIDGHLVREVKTPGGRLGFWDGKDKDGADVSSGVYIIVAYSEDGSKVAKGKVAVIKR
jgi:hypothetical protein